VQKDIAVRRCGLLAAIRASWDGSTTCNAVGAKGKLFPLACGHAKCGELYVLKICTLNKLYNVHWGNCVAQKQFFDEQFMGQVHTKTDEMVCCIGGV
jgi:hypothetical protein